MGTHRHIPFPAIPPNHLDPQWHLTFPISPILSIHLMERPTNSSIGWMMGRSIPITVITALIASPPSTPRSSSLSHVAISNLDLSRVYSLASYKILTGASISPSADGFWLSLQ